MNERNPFEKLSIDKIWKCFDLKHYFGMQIFFNALNVISLIKVGNFMY